MKKLIDAWTKKAEGYRGQEEKGLVFKYYANVYERCARELKEKLEQGFKDE